MHGAFPVEMQGGVSRVGAKVDTMASHIDDHRRDVSFHVLCPHPRSSFRDKPSCSQGTREAIIGEIQIWADPRVPTREDRWIKKDHGELLLWIPTALRGGLCDASATYFLRQNEIHELVQRFQ